jgi:cytochrome c oxidase assembly protein subunit 16
MPTFQSKPLEPSPFVQRIRRHPFILFGLPFISVVVIASFGMQNLTQARYDLHDSKVTTMSRAEELGMSKERKKVDLREEYYVSFSPVRCTYTADGVATRGWTG